MTYAAQLESKEWLNKRYDILKRDGFKCTKCGKERTKFLRLSGKFGVKTYSEMCKEGYAVSLHNNNVVMVFYKSFLNSAIPIDVDLKNTSLHQLKFAQQWYDSRDYYGDGIYGGEPHYQYLCFDKDLDDLDNVTDLNVHHKYYIEEKLAWEYDDDILVTLCEKCHRKEHAQNPIKILSKDGAFLYTANKCDRCNGSGYLPQYYFHRGGVCFKCWGHGVVIKELNNK